MMNGEKQLVNLQNMDLIFNLMVQFLKDMLALSL